MSTTAADRNAQIIDEFRANEGRVGGPFEGRDLLLLHHTGAKSGKSRINPAMYLVDAGRYVVFATNSGQPANPAWYGNVKANPDVSIEVGTETIQAVASEATGEERDRLYAAQVERVPQFADYEEKTERVIPVIVLTPVTST